MEKVEIHHNQMNKAITIMREVAKWGRDRGFKVWLDEWLTPEELLTEETRPEHFCVGMVNGEPACAFILQNTDSQYWGVTSPDEAVYLHKLCVIRKFAHREITKSVVEAIRQECREKGIKYIRLDTGLDEKVVRKIYLRAGVKIVDIIDYDNGKSMALYEMEF